MKKSSKQKKLCFISSSGGHYEELKMLAPLAEEYPAFWVTEKTDYATTADYYLLQTGLKDRWWLAKMFCNFFKSLSIWCREHPDYVITTGTMIAIPMAVLARLFRKRVIYIETFSRVYDGTRTGKLMYKFANLFIVQWESLLKVYPKAVYGGSIF